MCADAQPVSIKPGLPPPTTVWVSSLFSAGMSHLVQSAVVRNSESLDRKILTIPRGLAVTVPSSRSQRRKRGLIESEIDDGTTPKRQRFFGCTMSPLMEYTSHQAITVAGIAEVCFHFKKSDKPMQTRCLGAPVYVHKPDPPAFSDPNRGRFSFSQNGDLPVGFFVQPTSNKTGNVFIQGTESKRAVHLYNSAKKQKAVCDAMAGLMNDNATAVEEITATWNQRNLRDRLRLVQTTKAAFKRWDVLGVDKTAIVAVAASVETGSNGDGIEEFNRKLGVLVKAVADAVKVGRQKKANEAAEALKRERQELERREQADMERQRRAEARKEDAQVLQQQAVRDAVLDYERLLGELETILIDKGFTFAEKGDETHDVQMLSLFIDAIRALNTDSQMQLTEIESEKTFGQMVEDFKKTQSKEWHEDFDATAAMMSALSANDVLLKAARLVNEFTSNGMTMARMDTSLNVDIVAADAAAAEEAMTLSLTPTVFGLNMSDEAREEAVSVWKALVAKPATKSNLDKSVAKILDPVLKETAITVNVVFGKEVETDMQKAAIAVFTRNAVTRVLTDEIKSCKNLPFLDTFGEDGAYLAAEVIAAVYQEKNSRLDKMIQKGITQAKNSASWGGDDAAAHAGGTWNACREELEAFYANHRNDGAFMDSLQQVAQDHADRMAQLGGRKWVGKRVPREVVDWHRSVIVASHARECETFSGLESPHEQRMLLVEFWMHNWAILPLAARPQKNGPSGDSTLNVGAA